MLDFPMESQSVFKGTTTVGVVCADGVVLAADKRAVSGYFIANKNVQKIVMLKPYVAVTIAGTVAEAQLLLDRLKASADLFEMTYRRRMPVKALASLASHILADQERLSHYIIQLLFGGYDDDGPSLYAIDVFGALTQEKVISTGSGSSTALGQLQWTDFTKLSMEEAAPKIRKAVEAAMQWDPATGEGVDILAIGKDGSKRY